MSKNQVNISFRHSIVTRLLLIIFFIYLIAMLVVMSWQLVVDYYDEKDKVETEIARYETLLKSTLSESLWYLDNVQIMSILQGVSQNPLILGVEVKSFVMFEPSWQVGPYFEFEPREIRLAKDKKKYPFLNFIGDFDAPLVYRFDITRNSELSGRSNIILGEVYIYADSSVIFYEIMESLWFSLINNIFISLIIWLFFFYAGYRYLARPLKELTLAVQSVTKGDMQPVFINKMSKADNEISLLANNFNIMVSKIHQVQSYLTLARQDLAQIIEAMPSVLIVLDENNRITEWNSQAEFYTGVKRKQAIGSYIDHVFPLISDYKDDLKEALITNNIKKISQVNYETLKGGFYFDVLIYPLISSKKLHCVIRLDDVSKEVQMQDVLAQTEKMTSIGQFSAGIAHEINNPLGAILQNTQNIKRRLFDANKKNIATAKEYNIDFQDMQHYLHDRSIINFLDAITQSGERAAKIVLNLLRFSRQSHSNLVLSHIKDIIEKSIDLISMEYRLTKDTQFDALSLNLDIPNNLPMMMCEPSELQQVFINLIQNAADAILETGRSDGRIDISVEEQNQELIVSVKDNGGGIPEDVRKRVFEPFYTTKEIGKGTGLGLSVSYHIIVDTHKGNMSVNTETENEENRTVFTIRLPLNQPSAD